VSHGLMAASADDLGIEAYATAVLIGSQTAEG